ncbi:peptidase M28 [Chryseomicrobium excrementi]|uniref:Peptidase M28 n=1 Tax=Chryseomicrobium excrementi TaxID=2041346 RepID=A0A2M9EY99_9BACL|nr:M20/M25/M40 family metallo-hydrolase [Chryseomicrobium excrementi]PJK16178.1 peptidase M28 [Chryseomicrobium excrementi]
MENWSTILNGYGFACTVNESRWIVIDETISEESVEFLSKVLKTSGVQHFIDGKRVHLEGKIPEEKFVESLSKLVNPITEMMYYPEALPSYKLDVYIAGIVRQLNRLGLLTCMSCDGHGTKSPYIHFQSNIDALQAEVLFRELGVKVHVSGASLRFKKKRESLPGIANQLAALTEVPSNKLTQKKYEETLEELLLINGESGEEATVRNYVTQKMSPLVDEMFVDDAGNLHAKQVFGEGPTIILNAHLDTVSSWDEDKEILKHGWDVWSSSTGILGADDRAGVAVLLGLAHLLPNSSFDGTIHYIFTVEEEIGLCGARAVTPELIQEAKMAFVIDRRGKHDIVVGSQWGGLFCSEEFGQRVERIARRTQSRRWTCTLGGSSDTRIWVSHGIESVNLSAGYMNEHTEDETLDVRANLNTLSVVYKLVEDATYLLQKKTQRPLRSKSAM